MTLQQAVFAGLVDPGNLVGVREIVNNEVNPADCAAGAAAKNCDTATFAGLRSGYSITTNANGSVTVSDNSSIAATAAVPATGDGTDTLFNIEQLKFSDTTEGVTLPAQPTITSVVGGNTQATVNFTTPTTTGITGFTISVLVNGTVVRVVTGIAPTATSVLVTGLTNGTTVTFTVAALNGVGTGPESAPSAPVTPASINTVPAAPVIGNATAGNGQATVRWTPGATGGTPITEYRVQVFTGTTLRATVPLIAGTATSRVVTGLPNGTAFNFRVLAVNALGAGPVSGASNVVTPATVPGAPGIGAATSGLAGGLIQARATWTAPAATGGAPITGYVVRAFRLNAAGTVVATVTSATQPATARALTMTLPAGNYRFTVQAVNRVGGGAQSLRSNLVVAR
jgi:hypothetical protein